MRYLFDGALTFVNLKFKPWPKSIILGPKNEGSENKFRDKIDIPFKFFKGQIGVSIPQFIKKDKGVNSEVFGYYRGKAPVFMR